jgi:hypothetical protein
MASRMHRASVRGIALFAALMAFAPAVHASTSQETIVEDDGLLQRSGPDVQARALDDMKALGATTVRVLVGWRNLAPDPSGGTRPASFDPSDPTTYPAGTFDTLDALVRNANARGLDVLLTPTGAIPDWASQCTPAEIGAQARNTCKPDPAQYQQFVEALGRHFTGDLAVRRWSLWNEPNLESWLAPQWTRQRGATIDASAVLYRRLAAAGILALRNTGHGGDQILLGETAPTGSLRSGSSAAPLRFAARVLCLDDGGRPLRGSDATRYDCRHPKKLTVTGYAHHPYTQGGFRPPTASVRNSGEVTLGYIARLESLLSGAKHYRRVPSGTRIWNTEYGFQTNPPDRFGMSLAEQALYLNQSEYISWLDPWLESFAQYNLADDPDTAAFNTGLMFDGSVLGGARKPSYDAFATPIYVTRASSTEVYVWGGARPLGPGHRVAIQVGSADRFPTVATATTGSGGYVRLRLRKHTGRWRLAWTDGAGNEHLSRPAAVNSTPVRRR